MKKDLKISLPLYKIGYSLAFIVILSCVHSVVYINEIGPAIDEKMAVLAMVFCADTYLIEKQCRRREVFRLYSIKNQYHAILRRIMAQIGYLTAISILTYGMFYWIEKQCRRREVFRLYSIKNQYHAILRRIMAQIGYLTAISILTYGMFYWQRPVILDEKRSEIFLFLLYCTVVFITIFFWSVLSVTVCNLLQSIWGGMGMLFLVWLFLVSKAGGELLGVWNITIFFWSVLSVTVCNLLQSIWGGMGMLFLVWLFLVSKAGGELLGVWNPFSYEFCELTDLTEWKWAAGKILTAVCAVILLLLQKKILEKRG